VIAGPLSNVNYRSVPQETAWVRILAEKGAQVLIVTLGFTAVIRFLKPKLGSQLFKRLKIDCSSTGQI
jgi:phosphoserine phosphatase